MGIRTIYLCIKNWGQPMNWLLEGALKLAVEYFNGCSLLLQIKSHMVGGSAGVLCRGRVNTTKWDSTLELSPSAFSMGKCCIALCLTTCYEMSFGVP